MTTALEIVEAALSDLGVLGAGDTLSPEDAQLGLRHLNNMILSWETEGLDVDYTALSLTDDFSLDEEYHGAAIALLSARLYRPFNTSAPDAYLTQQAVNAIQSGFRALPTIKVDAGLLGMPSQEF